MDKSAFMNPIFAKSFALIDSSPCLMLKMEISHFQDAFWKGGPRIDKTDGSFDGGKTEMQGFVDQSLSPL